MPYIPEDTRAGLDAGRPPENVGELTYAITMLVDRYLAHADVNNFATFGEVLAALEASKLEFYRRVVVPYEDLKCAKNGDVYPEWLRQVDESATHSGDAYVPGHGHNDCVARARLARIEKFLDANYGLDLEDIAEGELWDRFVPTLHEDDLFNPSTGKFETEGKA